MLRTADHFVQTWNEGGALIQMLVDVMELSGIVAISISDSISISNNNISVSTTKRRNRTAQPQPLIVIPPCSISPVINIYLNDVLCCKGQTTNAHLGMFSLPLGAIIERTVSQNGPKNWKKLKLPLKFGTLIWAMGPTDDYFKRHQVLMVWYW